MEKLSLEHFIHSYECGPDGKLRLLALFNMLQNIELNGNKFLDTTYDFINAMAA